ncbi:MAG TPA: hypothetical protein VFO89_01160 [Thermoanaerobaculia bacterium]|nr:hypothetical protein [Thermoanaerobaculia bacterium]
MRIRVHGLLVILCLLTLTACSSFKEVYHFKATSCEHTNYFRVTVKGGTFFSASQYAAGNYDTEAVDALFGELTGPGARVRVDSTTLQGHTARGGTQISNTTTTTTTTTTEADSNNAAPAPKAAVTTLGGDSLDRKTFVFFLSSNSDFFVNQIQTYVTTREMQQSIVTLILKDDVAKLEQARLTGRTGDAAAENLAAQLRSIVAELRTPADGSVTNADATAAVVSVLKTLARNSAVSQDVGTITNVATARTWLQNHPRAFAEGVNP